jgi:hypothetical protein
MKCFVFFPSEIIFKEIKKNEQQNHPFNRRNIQVIRNRTPKPHCVTSFIKRRMDESLFVLFLIAYDTHIKKTDKQQQKKNTIKYKKRLKNDRLEIM